MANLSNNRVLRAVLSTLAALLIAASGVTLTVTLAIRLGWFNEKLLKTELGNNSYVSQSIDIMKKQIYELVSNSLIDTEGLDGLLDEDELYTTFYSFESQALSGKEVSYVDVEEFSARLTAYFDERLTDVFLSEASATEVNVTIAEAVNIYKSYMHTDIFERFHKLEAESGKNMPVIIGLCMLIMAMCVFALIKMYHYKRHAYAYCIGGIAAAILVNIFFGVVMLNGSLLDLSGVKPECYSSLAKSMTQYGGYVCFIVTGFLTIALCLFGYLVSRSRKR